MLVKTDRFLGLTGKIQIYFISSGTPQYWKLWSVDHNLINILLDNPHSISKGHLQFMEENWLLQMFSYGKRAWKGLFIPQGQPKYHLFSEVSLMAQGIFYSYSGSSRDGVHGTLSVINEALLRWVQNQLPESSIGQ